MAVIGVVLATLLTIVSFTNGGKPNFWLFTLALAITVPLAQGLVPNANTAAMMPVPHVAGTASAIIATITTAGGALLGGMVVERLRRHRPAVRRRRADLHLGVGGAHPVRRHLQRPPRATSLGSPTRLSRVGSVKVACRALGRVSS